MNLYSFSYDEDTIQISEEWLNDDDEAIQMAKAYSDDLDGETIYVKRDLFKVEAGEVVFAKNPFSDEIKP